jgi:hypothetical protein
VEVKQLPALVDPFIHAVEGCLHVGEELQDPQAFLKRCRVAGWIPRMPAQVRAGDD